MRYLYYYDYNHFNREIIKCLIIDETEKEYIYEMEITNSEQAYGSWRKKDNKRIWLAEKPVDELRHLGTSEINILEKKLTQAKYDVTLIEERLTNEIKKTINISNQLKQLKGEV